MELLNITLLSKSSALINYAERFLADSLQNTKYHLGDQTEPTKYIPSCGSKCVNQEK